MYKRKQQQGEATAPDQFVGVLVVNGQTFPIWGVTFTDRAVRAAFDQILVDFAPETAGACWRGNRQIH
jgi:hypothetical protein